jgi:hypothetical protein
MIKSHPLLIYDYVCWLYKLFNCFASIFGWSEWREKMQSVYSSVSQTVVRGRFRKKNNCKNCVRHKWKIYPYMSVLKLHLLVDLQQKVGELVISITSHPTIIISVVMVTLITSIMFLLFTCMQLWGWRILQSWSTCAPTAYEVVCDWQKFEKHWGTWYANCKECDLRS